MRSGAGRTQPPIGLPRIPHLRSSGRISDAVHEALSEAIRDLRLLPGAAISEPSLAEWLEVSRSPVRAAMARLSDLGLVTVVPQVGTYIAAISLKEVEEAVFVRSSLETSAFRRAIQLTTPDTTEIQRLVDINTAAAHRSDVASFFETDESLHQNIFELAKVGRIWGDVRRTKIQLDRLRMLSLPQAIHDSALVEDHQLIVDALKTRDEKLGVETITRHSTRILETIEYHQAILPHFFKD